MPFGKWENFAACKTDMMGAPNNYDAETAEKVCGKLQARLEGKEIFRILKSKTGRRILAQYVHVEGLDLEGDIIPLNRTREALEDLKARDPRTHNVMWRHSSYQIGWPLWTFTDEDGKLHKTEVDEYGMWGLTEIRNDGYQKSDEIWSHIIRGDPMGASIGVTSPQGRMTPVILTKDEILKRKLRKDWEGARYWDIPLQFIEPWSLTTTPANQYVTTAQILAKEGESPGKSAAERAKKHHNITDEKWNKLTEEEKQAYIDALPPLGQRIKKEKWYDTVENRKWAAQCINACAKFVKDPIGFCGAFWEDGKQWYHGPVKTSILPNLLKMLKMSWEECMAQARADPDVKDPDALCGWLRAHGPNAPKKQTECSEGKHWDEDEEACVPDEPKAEEITKSFMLDKEARESLIQNVLRRKHV